MKNVWPYYFIYKQGRGRVDRLYIHKLPFASVDPGATLHKKIEAYSVDFYLLTGGEKCSLELIANSVEEQILKKIGFSRVVSLNRSLTAGFYTYEFSIPKNRIKSEKRFKNKNL